MQSATLLAAEIRDLQAENQKAKKKRSQKKPYVGKGGVMIAVDVQKGNVQDVPSKRAPRRCSKYRSFSHTAWTCQEL